MYKPKVKSGARAVLRLLRGVGKGDFSASQFKSEELKQPKTFNVQVYLKGKRRMHEIEKMKAMIIIESRHQNWKAGGPV